jgi:hypothetical protein
MPLADAQAAKPTGMRYTTVWPGDRASVRAMQRAWPEGAHGPASRDGVLQGDRAGDVRLRQCNLIRVPRLALLRLAARTLDNRACRHHSQQFTAFDQAPPRAKQQASRRPRGLRARTSTLRCPG